MSFRSAALVVAVTAGLVLSACTAPPPPSTPVELTYASWIFISQGERDFMADVESSSGGSITFTAIENWTEPDGVEKMTDEFSMAEAIAEGEIDVGWSSTRSFPALGIDGFKAIEAPFLIQNPEATLEIVTGEIGQDALAAFEGTGVTPLAIYPGTVRFPLTAGHPLLEPSDWAGKDVLYYAPSEDTVQGRTIVALGGHPVGTGLHLIDDLNDGLYGAGIDSLGDIAAGGANSNGPYPTSNVVLWPTIYFTVMNTETFEALDASQRAAITGAAGRDAELAMEVAPSQALATRICSLNVKFGTATPEQLAALRSAVEPVYEWLRNDPAEAPVLEALEDIAAAHPEPDIVKVPEGCAWASG